MKKIAVLVACTLLGACASKELPVEENPSVQNVSSDQIIGVWKCDASAFANGRGPEFKTENNYAENKTFNTTGKMEERMGSFSNLVSITIEAKGTWQLDGNVLIETAAESDAIANNMFSRSVVDKINSDMPEVLVSAYELSFESAEIMEMKGLNNGPVLKCQRKPAF